MTDPRSLRSLGGSWFPPMPLRSPTTRKQPTHPVKRFPRSLRSLGSSWFPPMPLRTVPHRFRCFGRRERARADGAALTRSLHPSQLHPCSTSSGCRPTGGKPPVRLRVLSVLARFARSQPAMRLELRAAVRLRLSVGLLPTGSNALAFRAVCSRASLP